MTLETTLRTQEPNIEKGGKSVGRVASLLNNLRSKNPFGGTSYGYFYLTNECNYACDMCYMDSRPGLKSTRLNPSLATSLMDEFNGIDEIVLSGGEITVLPYFEEQIIKASEMAGFVTVFTNGTGFIDRKRLNQKPQNLDDVTKIVKESMELKLAQISENVEITLPVTEFHLANDATHKSHRYHEAIVKAGALLAREWEGKSGKPKIRFIVKNTPGIQGSGDNLIQQYSLQGLGSTGAAFPGGISQNGRGRNILEARAPLTVNSEIEGGIHINYQGVYANEPSLLQNLHFNNVTEGKILAITPELKVDNIVKSVESYINLKANK